MTQATAQVLPFIPKPPSFGDMLVTEGFNRDISGLPRPTLNGLYRVVTPEKLADLRVFARQYKPSIR